MSEVPSTVATLMYHELSQEWPRDRYGVSVSSFEAQMQALADAGYMGLSIADFLGARAAGRRAVLLTFDDGYASDVELALPVLQKHGFTATFFVTTGAIGQADRISESQIVTLHRAAMEIGCHGHTHDFLDAMQGAELQSELTEPRRVISALTGTVPVAMSLPGGRQSAQTVAKIWEAGYRVLGTSVPTSRVQMLSGTRWIFGRVPMSRSQSAAHIVAIAGCGPMIRARNMARYQVAALLKRALGGAQYHRVWKMLSRGKREAL
jgi:peptidoglycan/xylan/chitin deacetylase (PgdA/CDA1 family)